MSTNLSSRDKNVIWHPYTAQKYAAEPIPIIKGEGVWLVAENGERYIDAVSSWWVTIHGHANPYIAQRIHEQALLLEQVIFAGFTHEPAVSLAERLLPILPGTFSKVFYSDNGSTATEVAVKMAIQYWWNKGVAGRSKILALKNAYHGDTFGAMSVSERGLFTMPFQDKLFDVYFAETPKPGEPVHIAGFSDQETAGILDSCACVIYEPLLQGAGGMIMYEPEALDQFISVCRHHGIICIADEVMTGFGRTGNLFASYSCNNKPDIICLSKGLTGGTMALGVTACTSEIHSAFINDDKKKTFFHGHSFTANPIACAAALASLDLIQATQVKKSIQMIVDSNKAFAEKLNQSRIDLSIENIRQCGTVVAFEVKDDVSGYSSSIRDIITRKCLMQGVYLRPLGNTVYIMPPYCITPAELKIVYNTIISVIADLK